MALVERRQGDPIGRDEAAAGLAARGQRQMALGIVSLGTGIPITAIAGSLAEPGLAGIIAAWAGIVGVNLAHALQGRRDR